MPSQGLDALRKLDAMKWTQSVDPGYNHIIDE
jgi:hypothetical protein